MSLAVGTIFSILFLSTGAIFRYSLLQGPFSYSPFSAQHKTPFSSIEVVWYVLSSFVIHLSFISITSVIGFKTSMQSLYFLIIASSELKIDDLIEGVPLFLAYIIFISLTAYILGATLRWLVIRYKLDIKYNFMKPPNEWYNLFAARVMEKSVDFIQLDILVRSDGQKAISYSGILEDYFLDYEGGIDRLNLINAFRDGKELKGDVLTVFGREIINIQVTYFALEKDTGEEKTIKDSYDANEEK